MRKMLITILVIVFCMSMITVVFATQPKEGVDPSQLNYCKEGMDNVTDCVMPIDDTYCIEDYYGKCMPVDNCIGDREFNCIVPPEPFEPYIQYVFKDVWDEDAWYFEHIYDVYERGLMIGYPDSIFGLGEELTWAQTITLAMRTEHYLTGKVYTQKYTNPQYWYSEDLANALESGILKEVPANLNAPIPRGEMAVIFSKVIPGFKERADYVHQTKQDDVAHTDLKFNDLKDVNEEVSYAVNSLADMGIVNGKSQDLFAVNDPLRREEIATIISRIIWFMEGGDNVPNFEN